MSHLPILFSDGPLIFDNFDRADNNSLGSPWVIEYGTWGVINNEAYCISDQDTNLVYIPDVGSNDYEVSCSIKGAMVDGSNYRYQGLVFRYINAQNLFLFTLNDNKLWFSSINSNVWTDIASPAYPQVDGTYYRFKASCKGDSIKVFINNELLTSYTMSSAELTKFGSAKGVGLIHTVGGTPNATLARTDNFLVEKI